MIPLRLHATLDAVSALALIAGPTLLGWPRRLIAPVALAGVGVAAYSPATRYRAASDGSISFDQHRLLDAAQGLAAGAAGAAAPPVRGAMAGYGAFSVAAAVLTKGEGGPGRVPLTGGSILRPARGHAAQAVAPDLAYRRLGIVNVVFLGPEGAGDRGRVLVDAGLPGTAGLIAAAAAERFGRGARPAAIVMTHGHFDHVGALRDLADRWDAPVYAHPAEMPYLDGTTPYPAPDPMVGGGTMAALTQEPGMHGPPAYLTTDWAAARASARALTALGPDLLVTGHGRPARGVAMRRALGRLAARFDAVAVPVRGRFVEGAGRGTPKA